MPSINDFAFDGIRMIWLTKIGMPFERNEICKSVNDCFWCFVVEKINKSVIAGDESSLF
jgi:hypothetical protein